MANTSLRPKQQRKAFYAIGLFCMLVLVERIGATEFQVGGPKGWSVPDPNAQSFNQWAEAHRFRIGDSLLFNYAADQDSVLQVNQDDYDSCNTDSSITKFTDGHSVFKFEKSGPYYFISGNKDNCLKNEKLVVVVLADRTNQTTTSPPPSGEEPPSPPVGTVEINPTPSPIIEPPPSEASSSIISSLGCFGAFVASSLLLSFQL